MEGREGGRGGRLSSTRSGCSTGQTSRFYRGPAEDAIMRPPHKVTAGAGRQQSSSSHWRLAFRHWRAEGCRACACGLPAVRLQALQALLLLQQVGNVDITQRLSQLGGCHALCIASTDVRAAAPGMTGGAGAWQSEAGMLTAGASQPHAGCLRHSFAQPSRFASPYCKRAAQPVRRLVSAAGRSLRTAQHSTACHSLLHQELHDINIA